MLFGESLIAELPRELIAAQRFFLVLLRPTPIRGEEHRGLNGESVTDNAAIIKKLREPIHFGSPLVVRSLDLRRLVQTGFIPELRPGNGPCKDALALGE